MPSRLAAFSGFFAVLVAAMAWSALGLQYWLMSWSGPWFAVTVRFLSYFTILSNLLVACVATSAATGGNAAVLRFWRSARWRGLAALCITVTGIVYVFVLRSMWHLQGPQLVADRLLHYVVPLLYVGWWAMLLPHGALHWRDALHGLIFPVVFLAWTLIRGAITGVYPYAFLDVNRLGYGLVALNSTGLGLLFLAIGMAYVAIDGVLGRRASVGPPEIR